MIVLNHNQDKTKSIYRRKREQMGLTFSPLHQDYYAVLLLKYKRPKGWQPLLNGNLAQALENYKDEWASLPGSEYGQPTQNLATFNNLFAKYLEEELQGISDLHIERGFLIKFEK